MSNLPRKLRSVFDRALSADLLPAEIPGSFSNAGLSRLLHDTGVRTDPLSGKISMVARHAKQDRFTTARLRLLEGLLGTSLQSRLTAHGSIDLFEAFSSKNPTIPSSFRIKHRPQAARRIDIPHPGAQVKTAAFMSEQFNLILRQCSLSNYSVRFPARSPKGAFQRHSYRPSRTLERSPVSAFSYKYFHLFAKLVESRAFRHCEKEFDYITSTDIQQFFDSIYTHAFSWVGHSKFGAKQAKDDKNSFFSKLDELLMVQNFGETHGILIGPEFSRIAAEILLQKLDVTVSAQLSARGIVQGRDFEMFRYMDDFSIFTRTIEAANVILETIADSLSPLKLQLNKSKTSTAKTPSTSPQSQAIRAAESLILAALPAKCANSIHGTHDVFSCCLAPASITQFGAGIREMLFTVGANEAPPVGLLLRRLESHLVWLSNVHTGTQSQTSDSLLRHFRALIEIANYSFELSPKAGPAKSLHRILRLLIDKCIPQFQLHDQRAILRSLVFRESWRIARKMPVGGARGIECLHLLDIAASLDEFDRIDPREIADLCGFSDNLDRAPEWNIVSAIECLRLLKSIGPRGGYELARVTGILASHLHQAQFGRSSADSILISVALLQVPNFKVPSGGFSVAAALKMLGINTRDKKLIIELVEDYRPGVNIDWSPTYSMLAESRPALVY